MYEKVNKQYLHNYTFLLFSYKLLGTYVHVFLQIEERDGIPVSSEGVLTDVGDIVGPQVQVTQAMQGTQSFWRNLVKAVVT